MCSMFSPAAKPCISVSNGKFPSRKSTVTRAEVTMSPQQKSTSIFPALAMRGIPFADLHIQEIVERQSKNLAREDPREKPQFHPKFLAEAYERCRDICAEYAKTGKTFYLGTLLMTKDGQKAKWAIYVWCRRTDELVDGPNAGHMSPAVLNGWEDRLQDIFNGRPYDMLDAALTDTVFKFPLDIKSFRDMIEGMRMDTGKCHYKNFQELYLYCYYVAGTVGLMSVPVMGIAPESPVSTQTIYNAALHLGIGNQLSNILRDVGGMPPDGEFIFHKMSLHSLDYATRMFSQGKSLIGGESSGRSRLQGQGSTSTWQRWELLSLTKLAVGQYGHPYYCIVTRKILDAIEDNDYDNLTKRAYVGRTKKLLMLPLAYTRSLSAPSLILN